MTVGLGVVAGLTLMASGPWAAGVWVAVAYVAGRVVEGRFWLDLERERAYQQLELFAAWAEQALARAPEELGPEAEAYRQRLQADYHEAQAALEKLRR